MLYKYIFPRKSFISPKEDIYLNLYILKLAMLSLYSR